MSTITAIETQRRRGRFSIFVDGAFLIGVGERVVADLSLRVGQSFDPARLETLVRAEEVRKAIDASLRLLEIRARAQREIETRLKQKGYDEAVIGEVTTKLTKLGLLDDAQFAAQWVESRSRSRPGGVRKLQSELFQKGVARDIMDETLATVTEDDEIGLARKALAKKVRMLPDDPDLRKAEYQRLAGFLARRGFNWTVTRQALTAFFEKDADATDPED